MLEPAAVVSPALTYAINLRSTRTAPTPDSLPDAQRFAPLEVYTTQTVRDGKRWHRLRVGFFDDERAARSRLALLREDFPGAWLAQVSAAEQRTAGLAVPPEPATPPAQIAGESGSQPQVRPSPLGRAMVTPSAEGSFRPKLYAINLQSTRTAPDSDVLRIVERYAPLHVYATQANVAGTPWHRLRLGFFDSPAAAGDTLQHVREDYPDAWLAQVQALERRAAESRAPPRRAGVIAKPDISAADAGASEPATPAVDAAMPVPAESMEASLYAVTVNGQDFGATTILRTDAGRVLLRGTDLDTWRLQRPAAPTATFRGEDFYDPHDLPDGRVDIDEANLALALMFAAEAFLPTIVVGTRPLPEPIAPGLGGFFNYDLQGDHRSGLGDSATRLEGLFELGAFSPWGTAISNFLGQDLITAGAAGRGANSSLIRLESSWRRDWPDEALTLVAGDSTGRSGMWGRPVRFGGVQWGRNFAIQPHFITHPLPGLSGEAVLPSTADLYIDGMLRQSRQLTPGPFELFDLPVVTGSGEAQLVIRDLLGREQIVGLPFYTSNALLRAGLTDYGLELGFVREDLGVKSNDYGRFLVVATGSAGLSDRLTTEARMEVLDDQVTGGAGAMVVMPFPLLVTGAMAASRKDNEFGNLVFVGLERRRSSGITFTGTFEYASRHFVQLGAQPDLPPPRFRVNANMGLASLGRGSASLSYGLVDPRIGFDSEFLSAFYSLPLMRSMSLNAFVSKSLTMQRELIFGVTLTQRFGPRQTGFASYNYRDGQELGSLVFQQALPVGEGLGYRFEIDELGPRDRQTADGAWRTPYGTYRVAASHTGDITSYRASSDGGLALYSGRTKFMRPVDDSFAAVRVGEYADVGVYLNNQRVATTNEDGYAWLPGLLDYQNNAVTIETLDLPLDAEVDTDALQLVPYHRSAVYAEFPVRRSAGALLKLLLDDGDPLPVGAVVTFVGRDERFPVAQRGEVYVTGLETDNQLQATWRGQSCAFEVTLPDDAGPLPRIGPVLCSGIER